MVQAVTVGLVLVGAMSLYYGVPVAYVLVARLRLRRQARRWKLVALTFDDGPGKALTPAILSFLREHACKASFFVSGRNVEGREHIVRQIAQEGHEVCSHGYEHVDHWRTSPIRCIADIRAGWKVLDGALGRSQGTYPFRPPYGRLNLASLLYLWCKRVPIHFWTIDSADTWARSELPPADWCAQEVTARGGGVVLYHDFDRRRRQTQEYVLASVEAVLRGTNGSALACRAMLSLWENRRNGRFPDPA